MKDFVMEEAARTTVDESTASIWMKEVSVKVRGSILLDSVSFEAGHGEFAAVVGPSGCGKTTLLRALAGLQPVSAGEVSLAGYPLEMFLEHFPLASGFLPQFSQYPDELTVDEILRQAIRLRLPARVAGAKGRAWKEHLIGLAGLESFLHRRFGMLSGGQKRRLALAEALAADPPFLFLDELTSGLDPHAEEDLMRWLRRLAHETGKTILLVTHNMRHLELCDRVLFLSAGRRMRSGAPLALMEAEGEFEEIFRKAEKGELPPEPEPELSFPPKPGRIKTGHPPGAWRQLPVLFRRQWTLFFRDRGQWILHLVLILVFPALVAVFATGGLPQVRNLSLALEQDVVERLLEQLHYVRESFEVASLVSGLAMFQVILLTLMGANNGAREIAREREMLGRELRYGLSPWAYLGVKLQFVAVLSLVQAAWMAWFVKTVCGFPGSFWEQFGVLFMATLAMSMICLLISACVSSSERASLLAIFLVGLQLPLSGAVLALPDLVVWLTRPFICAYWGWSGYLQTLAPDPLLDVVREGTRTTVAGYGLAMGVLGFHVLVSFLAAVLILSRNRNQT